MQMLNVSHVSKQFGSHKIIDDLSFSIPEHSIYGFIGQNGAGKTTTMKLILGLYQMDHGQIEVNGEKVSYGQTKTNQFIGYLPDVPEYYSYMTPYEYLKFCGEITGMNTAERKARIPELLSLVGLEKVNKRIHGFSRGMKQRLGIAQALLRRPKLLICDEPTSALDPVGRKEILDILVAVKDTTTVLFSTHILSDVEKVCDRIGLLKNGSLAFESTMDEIHGQHSDHGFEIEFFNESDRTLFLQKFQSICPNADTSNPTRLVYARQKKEQMMQAMNVLQQLKICPQSIERQEPNLEDLFMEVIAK